MDFVLHCAHQTHWSVGKFMDSHFGEPLQAWNHTNAANTVFGSAGKFSSVEQAGGASKVLYHRPAGLYPDFF